MDRLKLFIRSLLHKIRIFLWLIFPKKSKLDLFGSSMISLSGRWNTEFEPFLSYISMFSILRQRDFKGSFLEFGGGYSSILAIQVLKDLEKYVSVDMYPQKYYRILNSKGNYLNFTNYVEIVPEITVSLQEAQESFEELQNRLNSYDIDLVRKSLERFAGIHTAELIDIIFDNKKDGLFNALQENEGFKDEISFYSDNNKLEGYGYCSQIKKESKTYDAIFYDCGEISSTPEWFATSQLIPIGGYALLHDIFYPKSIKNFLIACLITLSDEWEIIFIDEKSPQGALLAQRVKN